MTIFLLPPIVGVLIGLAAGGSLANLARLRLRLVWLLAPAVIVQVALIYAPPVPPEAGVDPLRWLLPLTFAPLLAFVGANLRLAGMWLVLAGFLMNAAVIVANGGLMPTNVAALERAGLHQSVSLAQAQPGIRLPRSKDVVLLPEETRLYWLSDTLVSPPLPRVKVLSAGDLFIAGGLAAVAAQATRGHARARKSVSPEAATA